MTHRLAPSFVADEIRLHDGYQLREVDLVEIAVERRNDQGWPVNFAAGRIFWGDNAAGVGVWAVGACSSVVDVGPIWAINDDAKANSEWGAAAQPGSQVSQNQDLLAS